jgi:hypothetical protein
MKIISIAFIFAFLFSSGRISAQVANDSADKDQVVLKDNVYETSQIDVPSPALKKSNKLHTGLEVGTSFTYSPGNFVGPSFYIAPNLTYKVSPRFLVQAGIGLERSNFYSLYNSNDSRDILPMTQAFVYARGSYLISSNLTVDGTVYKTFNDVPKLSGYSPAVRYSQNGAIVGINYKLNNSISIGFHVKMSNNSYNFQNSDPFNPYMGF